MCKLHIIYTCMHHTSNHSLICRLNTWWEFASSSSHKKNKLSTVNRSQRARAHTSSYLRVLLHIFIVCVDHNSQFCVCSVFWHLRSITQLHHSFLVNGMPHTHTLWPSSESIYSPTTECVTFGRRSGQKHRQVMEYTLTLAAKRTFFASKQVFFCSGLFSPEVLMIFIHSQARPIDFHCFCMHFVCDSLVSGSKTFLRNFLMHCAHEKCVDFYFGLKQWMCLGFDFLHFTSSGLTKFAFSRWQWKMRNHDLWSPTVSPLFDQTADGF